MNSYVWASVLIICLCLVIMACSCFIARACWHVMSDGVYSWQCVIVINTVKCECHDSYWQICGMLWLISGMIVWKVGKYAQMWGTTHWLYITSQTLSILTLWSWICYHHISSVVLIQHTCQSIWLIMRECQWKPIWHNAHYTHLLSVPSLILHHDCQV